MEQMKIEQPSLARTASRLGLGLIAVILASSVISYLAYEIAWANGLIWYYTDTVAMLVSDVGMYLVGVPLLLLICRSLPSDPMPLHPQRTIAPKDFAKLGLMSYAGLYLANLVTLVGIAVLELLRGGDPFYNAVDEMLTGIDPLAAFLLIAVLPAIGEELVFRGYLYKKLARFGPKTYIFVSALLFSTFHATLEQMLYAFVLGLLFAWITWQTKSVYYSMFLHFLINFLSANVLEGISSDAAWAVMDFALIAVVAVGVILLIRNRKNFRLPTSPDWPENALRTSICNVGMIAWLCFVAFLVVATYV